MAAKGEDAPAMKLFRELKEQHAGALLLYQIGDFFETFFDDAKSLAATLGITLTSRGEDKGGEPIPMAGFPVRALDQHLPRLLEAGLRVVVCEQTEDSALAKGLVRREVTRVITPGTVTEESLLEPRRPVVLACWLESRPGGLAWAELTTGRFSCQPCSREDLPQALARLEPAELLLPEKLWTRASENLPRLREITRAQLTPCPDFAFDERRALECLRQHFGVATLAGFGFAREDTPEVSAAGALLAWLLENQRGRLAHLRALERFEPGEVMPLDRATLEALEIARTLRERSRAGTLLEAVDETLTPMGARELRSWLMAPLREARRMAQRHAAVEELVRTPRRLKLLREALAGLPDLERLCGRLGTGRAGPRDLAGLRDAAARIPEVANAMAGAQASLLACAGDNLDRLEDLSKLLREKLADAPPLNLRDGGVIRQGVNAALDEQRTLSRDSAGFLERFAAEEARRTGIASLKVGFNSVFGYYIEVTNAQAAKVPAHYVRRQTLKGAERFITPELKDFESRALGAERQAQTLEAALFAELRDEVTRHLARVLAAARLCALLDTLASLAQVAQARGWCRPEITQGRELRLIEARHPVLERELESGRLVPNDLTLGPEATLATVTGPNMAGKSTCVRTVALCVVLAQAGSFVPARQAVIGLCDRVFTRLGSADDIARGQSTFMVEMAETANILNHATERSLVVLDEVGRGTSTFDGVSIAWAVSEFLLRLGARTIFATHYHELTQLALRHRGVTNLNVAVREAGEHLVFLHRIEPGGADRSYGIHVARLAGIPDEVVTRARAVLQQLEQTSPVLASDARPAQAGPQARKPAQLTLFSVGENRAMKALREVDISRLSPEQALAELLRLRELARDQG